MCLCATASARPRTSNPEPHFLALQTDIHPPYTSPRRATYVRRYTVLLPPLNKTLSPSQTDTDQQLDGTAPGTSENLSILESVSDVEGEKNKTPLMHRSAEKLLASLQKHATFRTKLKTVQL